MSIGSISGGAAAAYSGLTAPDAAKKAGGQSAVDAFLALANMTPAQRMRAGILQSMGLNEDDLKAMTPQQRQAVEQQIRDRIKQAALDAADKGKTGLVADISA